MINTSFRNSLTVMLGRQHLMLTLATGLLLSTPFIDIYPGLVLTGFIGLAVGSLIPDVDAHDSAVFHTSMKGLNTEPGKAINIVFMPVIPFFGYSTKYLIYKPAVHVMNFFSNKYSFHERHRSFSHSILGVFTMAFMTGLYITPVLLYLQIFSLSYLAVFLGAYSLGAFLHMLQDSCTKTGIAWNTPFSNKKLKGNITTGEDTKHPRTMFYLLSSVSVIAFYIFKAPGYSINILQATGLSILSTGLCWLIFLETCEVCVSVS